MRTIKGKAAFITGGTKGIGYGIAQALVHNEVHVAITGRSEKTVEAAVSELKEQSRGDAQVLGIVSDVKDHKAVKKAVRSAVDAFGKLDILIANAGLTYFAPVDELSVEQWDEVIQTNLSGVFYTLKAGVEQLKENKGYFISIASLAGTNFFKGGSAYNASKFGVTGFTQAAMLDLRVHGIKSTVIMPGSVATHFNGNIPSEKDAWKIQKEDIGLLVVDLLQMDERALPSKVEIRPSFPPSK